MLSRDLFLENRALADACLDHPFICGLADGTLDREVFKRYVAQDAFFLQSFGQAYCVAAARAPDNASFGVLLEMANGVLEELKLHRACSEELGIDLDRVEPLPSTLAYTDFLGKSAWHDGFAVTLAAMAPCMRLYAWLGQRLSEGGVPVHDYRAWIATYSSAEFEELAKKLEDLLDLTGADRAAVHSAYARAMELELAFFEGCLNR